MENEVRYIQFFDTETNGLPKKWGAPITDSDNWPRIIQLAWMTYDLDDEICVSEGNKLIKPDGWEIPKEKFWIDNGFTTEDSEKTGVSLEDAIADFGEDYNRSIALVAHNMNFDKNILGAELWRLGVKWEPKPKLCTMQPREIVKFVGAKNKRGGPKWPKLEELYRKLFDEMFDNAHDAMADVRACAKCFFELRRRGVYFTSI